MWRWIVLIIKPDNSEWLVIKAEVEQSLKSYHGDHLDTVKHLVKHFGQCCEQVAACEWIWESKRGAIYATEAGDTIEQLASLGFFDRGARGESIVDNPLLDEFARYYDMERAASDIYYIPDHDYWLNWTRLRLQYALAIPTEGAIKLIAEHGPVVEVGAGLGYWAYVLSQIGCDVVAYDTCPGRTDVEFIKDNEFTLWFDVQQCDEAFVPPADRSLFLCWPPNGSPMAFNALTRYQGDTLIYIGEGRGLACADDKFFDELLKWRLLTDYALPQFDGLHDCLEIYKRGGTADDTVQPDD